MANQAVNYPSVCGDDEHDRLNKDIVTLMTRLGQMMASRNLQQTKRAPSKVQTIQSIYTDVCKASYTVVAPTSYIISLNNSFLELHSQYYITCLG